jgi:acetyl esterase/lipase
MLKRNIVLALSALTLVSCGSSANSSSSLTSQLSSSASSSEEVVNYTLTKGVDYVGDGSKGHKADMYLPKGMTTSTPAVILIHGGAFKVGDETMFSSTAKWLANHEIGVACISYRLYEEAIFPAGLADIKAAIRYVRSHASTYNFNPDPIVTWGESAGVYLSVMAALTSQDSYTSGDITSNASTSSEVQYCVDFYGPICVKQYKDAGLCNFLGITTNTIDDASNADIVSKSDPLSYVSSFTSTSAPQFLIQHGDADTTVSNEESKYLQAGLVSAFGASKSSLTIMPGLHHMDKGFYTDSNLTLVSDSIKSYFSK